MLTDPIRSVRIEAARLLAGTQPNLLQESQKTALDRAISELIASEMAAADRPENHVNLALLYSQMGRMNEAESELQTALRLDPRMFLRWSISLISTAHRTATIRASRGCKRQSR